jgi:hypothetical protein
MLKYFRSLLLLSTFIGLSAFAHAQQAQPQFAQIPDCQLRASSGQSIASASVWILSETNGPVNTTMLTPQAPIFSSNIGGALTQPIQTNGQGRCTAYASSGLYTLVFSSPITGQTVVPDVLIGNPAGIFSGAWIPTTTYNSGNVVTFDGQVFVSLQVNNTENEPGTSPTFWSAFSLTNLPATFASQSSASPAEGTFTNFISTTANVSGPSNAQSVNGVYGISNFGIKCDGATDDSAGLNAIGKFAAAQPAGNTITVSFPSNAVCVHTSTITSWIVSNLHVLGNGSRLKFTGTGKQIYLHGPGRSITEFDNIWIEGFVLQGNPNATDGIYQDNSEVARGRIDIINAQDYTDACFYLPSVQLSDYLDLNCSSQKALVMGTPQVTTPKYGLIAGDPNMLGGTGFFANNRVVTLSLEGVQLIGLWCKICTNQNHFFGTSEHTSSSNGTVGVGLVDGAAGAGQGNTFSMDFEGNSVADTQISGFGETFLSTVSLGDFTVLSGGLVNIFGGEYQQITLNSGHFQATIEGIFYNSLSSKSNPGTIIGNTSADCVLNAINRVGGAVTNNCLGGLYFPLIGGTITGNTLIDGNAQIIGNLPIGGILSTGGAATAEASNGDAVLANANSLRASSSANNATFPLIRGNSNSQVWLDPNGQGIVVGSGSNSIPFTSTTTPTAGSGVCWKTPTTLGTCTAGMWPNCTTCN